MNLEEYQNLIDSFDRLSDKEQFDDHLEELEGWLNFVELLCSLLIMRTRNEDGVSFRVGFKPSEQKLPEHSYTKNIEEYPFKKALRSIFDRLIEMGMQTFEAEAMPIWQLFRSGVFDDLERLAFMIALSSDMNRKFEQYFDTLSGDSSGSGRPTIGLVLDLCRMVFSKEECSSSRFFDDSTLFRDLIIIRRQYHGSLLGEEISLRKSVVMLLMGQEDEINDASGIIRLLGPVSLSENNLHEEVFDRLLKICRADGQKVVQLRAGEGCGKKFILRRFAQEDNHGIIRVHIPMLLNLDEGKIENILKELALKHILFSDYIYLEMGRCGDAMFSRLQNILRILQPYVFLLFIGGDESLPERIEIKGQKYELLVPDINRHDQETLWEALSVRNNIVFDDDVVLEQIVSKYSLTPGQIESALKNALPLGESDGESVIIGRELLEREIRALTGGKLLKLADKISTPFGISDILLRNEAKIQVEQLINRIKYRSIVNDTYGFGEKLPYGRGISVVLYGPPGTGKTMLACVIARELGLDLYRVDISAIGSKYIGETEKNIGALFEAAKGSNGILFFDEADALFAKRTDIENSNDKHANSEVAFLLQQIEAHDGLSILATNAVQSFDAAFKRRMTYFIPVDKPDEAERLEIWQNIFPKGTPLENNVNFELYSKVDGMTGSTIKAAAITAAYFAAQRGEAVSNNDIIEALDIEYRKAGNMMGVREILYASECQ